MKESLPFLAPWFITVLRYFLFAGIPFLIFYIAFPQAFAKNKIQVRLAKRKDFIREILHSMQTSLILVAIGLLFLKTPLRGITQVYDNINDYPIWWVPVSIIIALIIHDTYFYWMHRTVHHPKLFKPIHLLHHKSVNPSPWASYSFHFFEGILEGLFAPIILILIPIHPLSLVLFTFIAFLINVYGHLGYEIAPRWLRHSFLFELFTTSTHHNMHHEKFKGNYGLYFRMWDRLMGTEHPDYVEAYDRIQLRRFGYRKASFTWKNTLLLLLLFSVIGILGANAQSGIIGKWKDEKKGAVIEIYEENGLYFGKVISADDPKKNEKIEAHGNVVILKNFKKESETAFCCGTIFQPKEKRTLSGTLKLKNENTLKVIGKYGMLSGSSTWKKL